jgi:adenine phosphoribosyltransferase
VAISNAGLTHMDNVGVVDLRASLFANFRWRSDPPQWPEERTYYADYTRWWRDPIILKHVGPALAALFPDPTATVVMGTESRGSLLGPLVATHLAVGYAEVRKGAMPGSDDDQWLTRLTPPDYRDRHVELAIRRGIVRPADRVLFVDDWVASGGQASACQQLTQDVGATWVGAAVIVDGLESGTDRRALNLRGLIHLRDLNRLP